MARTITAGERLSRKVVLSVDHFADQSLVSSELQQIMFYGKSGTGKSYQVFQFLRFLVATRRARDPTTILSVTAIEVRGKVQALKTTNPPIDLLGAGGPMPILGAAVNPPVFGAGLWGARTRSLTKDLDVDRLIDLVESRRTSAVTIHNRQSSRKHLIYFFVSLHSLKCPF